MINSGLYAELSLKGTHLYVEFPDFDATFSDDLFAIGGKWTRSMGAHEFSRSALPKILELLTRRNREARKTQDVVALEAWLIKPMELPPTARTPYAHQITGADYLLKNPQAVLLDEQGCIDGAAMVSINRAGTGETVSLERLHMKFHGLLPGRPPDPSIPTYIRALCDGYFRQHKIKDVVLKGTRPVVRLMLGSGKSIRLTPDHEVLSGDGTWVPAGQLKSGQTVVTNGTPACKRCRSTTDVVTGARYKFPGYCRTCIYRYLRKQRKWAGGTHKDKDGYVRVAAQWDHPGHDANGTMPEHVLVMEQMLGRHLADDELIHHEDEDKSNNTPGNLVLMTKSEHATHHGKAGGFSRLDGAIGGRGGLVVFIPRHDTVVSVEPDGEAAVYDVVCADPYRNFVANGIVVHNCGKGFTALWATEARMLVPAGSRKFRCLIVAEVSMLLTWGDEITAAFPHRTWAVFNPKKPIPEGIDYLIVSWDMMRGIGYEKSVDDEGIETKAKYWTNLPALLAWKPDQLLGDEIYRCKNPKSDTAKALNLIHTDFAIGMTGTLIPNKVEDCWFPLSYFKPGILPSITRFKESYCVLEGGVGPRRWSIIGYKNLNSLEEIIKTETLRRKRSECLDMPERVFDKLLFTMTPRQRSLYLEYRDEMVDEINDEGEIVSVNMLTRIIRLSQIANNPRLVSDDLPLITSKYDALIERIDGSDEPFIVWSNYRAVLEYLKEKLGSEAEMFYGGVSATKRKDIIDNFNGGQIKVFLGLPAAGRSGITLNASNRMEWLDRNFNLLDRLQGQDRNYRIGQGRNVTVTDYIVPGTIDELTLTALKLKENTMERLTTGAISSESMKIPKSLIMDYLRRQDI